MKRLSLLFLALVALAAGLVLAAGDASHGPVPMHPTKVRYELAADSVSIPMTLKDGRIILGVLLDGQGPFPFVFDTGAHGSVMDLALAREQGLPLGREIMVGSPGGAGRPGRQVTIGTVGIGGLTMSQVMCVAFDGLPFPHTPDAPRGVLSPYGLSGLLITLDYPGRRVVFRPGALPAPDGREVFASERVGGLLEIPAKVAGQDVRMHLDSGAAGGMSLPTALADRLTLDGPLRDAGFAKTVDQVRALKGARVMGDFTIGRYTWENPTASFVDLAPGVGNVGAAFLSQFALTIDPASGRFRLVGPADGRVVVGETRKPRYGIQVRSIEASPLDVLFVDAGSPAERAGLRGGDRILQLNGHPLADLPLDDRLEALKSSPLAVNVQRGEGSLDFTMTLE